MPHSGGAVNRGLHKPQTAIQGIITTHRCLIIPVSGGYNLGVVESPMHLSGCSFVEAAAVQRRLAKLVEARGEVASPGFIAGVDVSVSGRTGKGCAAVAVLSFPGLKVVDAAVEAGPVEFPYIPGLLSFIELPLEFSAWKQLEIKPDLVIVDGHGIAHPRRLGIAAHFGLMVDVPVIGCAKSLLCGKYDQPGVKAGSSSPMVDGEEVIGVVLRTRDGVRPVFVSPGNHIGLEDAAGWVMKACSGYRLPEPLRQAHLMAGEANTGIINKLKRARR